MSREEAEAEAAWDPTEADPLAEQSYSFDSLYNLNDAVPEDVREELTRVGYGPPVRLQPACVQYYEHCTFPDWAFSFSYRAES